MANKAYLGVWSKDVSDGNLIDRFGAYLSVVPFSESKPGFTHLSVRAVGPAEIPILEQDRRSAPLDANGVVEILRDHANSDCAYEVGCYWDLATFDATARSGKEAQPLEIFCYGADYDDGVFQETGHFQADLGFEHFFTGHAGLLGFRRGERAAPQSAEEARFLEAMAWPENLTKYQEGTRTNVRKLFDWIRAIEGVMPVETVRLWSEGEQNFEARLEEILAAR
jgi:hypothetical protein